MADIKVIVVIIVAAISVCDSISMAEVFSNHVARVSINKYPCEHPQPRVIYLREIIGDDVWEEKYKKDMKDMRPFATVLHRCGGSGCCTQYNQRCVEIEQDIVQLTFLIASQGRYVQFDAVNHTKCGCDVISDSLIK